MDLEKVKKNMQIKNNYLSKFACLDSEAYRFREEEDDIRTPFFRDIDRIVYSLSYTRYMDKTQVFSFNDNDNISKRMTHVQMVSKIARTIGRALGLNEDLIEAAALGHDLGHVPFGHAGERILNEISLDAIMCHNGELELDEYRPCSKSKETFLKEYEMSYKDKDMIKKLVPGTLEGCVVRVSDIVAYIGRDIEDAIRMGIIKKDEIPHEISNVLGLTNREIINKIINDLIDNSLDKGYLKLSNEVFEAIKSLKKFNYKYIYDKANTKEMLELYEKMFKTVFNKCLDDLKKKNKDGHIYTIFLNDMSKEYLNKTSDERKVIDYIAGMTDDFLLSEYNNIIK